MNKFRKISLSLESRKGKGTQPMGNDDGNWFEKMKTAHAQRSEQVQQRLEAGKAKYQADMAAYGDLTLEQKIRAVILGSMPVLVLGIGLGHSIAAFTAAILGAVLSGWYTVQSTRDWKFGPAPNPASYVAPGARALLKHVGKASAAMWLVIVYCMNALMVLWVGLRISHAMG